MPKRTPVIVTDYRPKILAGSTTASGGAQTLIVHDINTSHSGNLLWSRLDKAGSSLADIVTRPHGALTDIDSNTHVDHTAVEIASGNGLTGGGFITESRTLAVGAGDGITVNANDVALTTPGTLSATTSNTASGNHTHAVSTGAASTLNATTANATGTSTNLARADHLHTITTGAASTLNATTANATGTSSNLARADHLHAITTGAASTLSATTANATGTSSSLARADHLHAISTGAASTLTVSTSNATGTSSNLARADHLHTITTSSNPGATASILASASDGGLGLLRLTSNSAFTSGFAGGGYRIDEGVSETGKTSAEFDNLTVRGRMRIYELLIQQIRATNGSMFVSSSSRAEVVTEDNDWYVNGEQLELNGVGASFDIRLFTIRTRTTTGSGDRNLYHGFLVNDILRAQRVDISTGGGLITRQVNLLVTKFVDLWEYDALLVSSDEPVVGDEMVRLGSTTDTTRQGSIYLTSDDSDAPFIDIVDEVASHAEWNQAGKIKARLGKLSGIVDNDFGEPISGYGLYSDNVYLKGQIVVGDASNKLWLNDANDGGLAIGGATKASAPFRVTATGALTSTSGAIGGWTIGSTTLTAGTGSNAVGISSGAASNAFWAGNTNNAAAPFRVSRDGYLYAESGLVGGWILGLTSLTNLSSGASRVGLVADATGAGVAIYAGDDVPANADFRVTANGALTATSATITGSVTSTSGAIGGWTLGANALTSGTVGLRSGQVSTGVAIYAGNVIPTSAPFQVTAAGALTATSATITGSVTSTSGAIGGWTLGANALTSGTVGLRSDATGAGVAIYAGDATPENAEFQVTASGALTATSATITGSVTSTSGAIGGWTIDSTTLKNSATSGASRVGLVSNATGTGVAIYAGSDTVASAPFRVTAAGALTSTSGAIGGWAIGSATISSSTLTIDSSGPSIRSGKSSYSDTTPGFWIGLDSSDSNKPKFHFGGTVSGVERYIRWSGTALEINQPTISQPSLSATWQSVSYNQDWGTFATGHALKYMRMGDFVFIHGWVENDTYHSYTSGDYPTITKSLPAPDGKQLIFARVGARDGNGVPIDITPTMEGYGEVLEISEAGWLTLLTYNVDTPPVILEKQDLIINGWYKAAA